MKPKVLLWWLPSLILDKNVLSWEADYIQLSPSLVHYYLHICKRKMSLGSVKVWVRVSALTLWKEVIEQVGSPVKGFCTEDSFLLQWLKNWQWAEPAPRSSQPPPSAPRVLREASLVHVPHVSACSAMKGPVSLCDGVRLTQNKWVWCSSIIASLNTAFALLLLPLQSISAITRFLSKEA